jgi:hypothetical protein
MIMALFCANIFDQLGEINTEKSLISIFFANVLVHIKLLCRIFLFVLLGCGYISLDYMRFV